jgi:hypothetical protein
MKKADKFMKELLYVCQIYSEMGVSDYEINKGLGEAFALGVVMPVCQSYITKKVATKTIKSWTNGVSKTAVDLYNWKSKQIKKG